MTINSGKHNTMTNKMCNRAHPKFMECGFANSNGLNLKFETGDDGSVISSFECDKILQGYPGILHGGIILMILDIAMGNCMFLRGQTTLTVEMNTKFRHPVLIKYPAKVEAKIIRISHPLYILESRIIQEGKVKAMAKGKFYDQPDLRLALDAQNVL